METFNATTKLWENHRESVADCNETNDEMCCG